MLGRPQIDRMRRGPVGKETSWDFAILPPFHRSHLIAIFHCLHIILRHPILFERDLLSVSRHNITACLDDPNAVDFFLRRCNAIDDTIIADDGGMLSKTLSVENSHRSGTVFQKESVLSSLRNLCNSLVKLLDERAQECSHSAPSTLRISICDLQLGRGRKRQSKQVRFDGKSVLVSQNNQWKTENIFVAAVQLLDSLLHPRRSINIINVNLALTNFSDTSVRPNNPNPHGNIASYFTTPSLTTSEKVASNRPMPVAKSSQNDIGQIGVKVKSDESKVSSSALTSNKQGCKRSIKSTSSPIDNLMMIERNIPVEIDAAVLSELPRDIAEEVINYYLQSKRPKDTGGNMNGIERFFKRKK
mmetsp:Transcript_12497/g.18770  ORF Transcript_12497/g.18770 Transcript_12497/m.18770 type:complete len:359 (-) Transcript_12497:549-1625(-)